MTLVVRLRNDEFYGPFCSVEMSIQSSDISVCCVLNFDVDSDVLRVVCQTSVPCKPGLTKV